MPITLHEGEWKHIVHIFKEKNCQLGILYPAKLSFMSEGEMKTFHNKQKWKGFVTTCQALQMMLKDMLHTEVHKDIHHYERMWRQKNSSKSTKEIQSKQ